METVKTYNGNKQLITKELPLIVILGGHKINDVALAHMKANTELEFKKTGYGLEAQPETSNQITRLLLTYNYKSQYHDNGSNHNTLFLKRCTNEGFKIDSVCKPCLSRNHVFIGDLKDNDILSV